jgi:hypothetical protein
MRTIRAVSLARERSSDRIHRDRSSSDDGCTAYELPCDRRVPTLPKCLFRSRNHGLIARPRARSAARAEGGASGSPQGRSRPRVDPPSSDALATLSRPRERMRPTSASTAPLADDPRELASAGRMLRRPAAEPDEHHIRLLGSDETAGLMITAGFQVERQTSCEGHIFFLSGVVTKEE